MVNWELSGETYHATVAGPGEAWFHMTVEPTGDGWDWAVWLTDEDREAARHGVALTVQDAVGEAEQAVK